MIGRPDILVPTRRRLWLPGDPLVAPRPVRTPRRWQPRPFWRERMDLMATGVQVGSGGCQVKPTGVLEASDGTPCCCAGNVCFTKFLSQWDCNSSTWGAWSSSTLGGGGRFCLDPTTTDTSMTSPTACSRQQYVRVSPDVNCTVAGDCTTDATAPPLPTGTPTGCTCNQCGCTHALPHQVRVTVAGSAAVACFAAADNTGSASVVGSIDGTYDIDRINGACAWVKAFSPAGFTMHRDCFDNNCSFLHGPDSPASGISVRFQRPAANTWRITVTGASGATFLYDSGNFAFNDQNFCDGTGSGAIADTLVGNVMPSACTPTSISMGATASAIAI